MKLSREVDRDANKLDRERAKMNAKMEVVIREQEAIIEVAEKSIDKMNSDLKALTIRLKKYTGTSPAKLDEAYSDLKDRYEQKLQERATLQRAKSMAEESITAARLHAIPGEG